MNEVESINVSPDERSNDELDSIGEGTGPSRSSERAMTKEPEKAPQTAKEDYEFTHNGKPIKATRDQILKWAQQGYDYPQKAQKLNLERSKWEQERTQFEQQRQKYSPYQQIDEWASKNPTQWQQLEQMWKQSQTNPQSLNGSQMNFGNQNQISPELQPYISKIQTLEQQLSQIVPLVQQTVEERQTFKQKEQDNELAQDIQSIREKYKDLDWQSLDENGKSLEYRVMEHAEANGISKFAPAFRDLLHDDLISRAQAQAKQSVSKGIQTRTKLGVLGESPTSSRGSPERTKNIRDTSYEELEQDIKEEIRRGKVS